MIHTLKPGLCWVEYILSIRGLFLPTVSWNLADGKYIIVDDYHVGGVCGTSSTCVFYLNMCLF